MNCAYIILIGKTGAGKSTLVNAIIRDKNNEAPTGKGGSVTKENKIYSCKKQIEASISNCCDWEINIYDTVGLELNEKVTEHTLTEVEQFLAKSNRTTDKKDIIIVWLCINQKSHRFENYELAAVRKLSMEYEVPFSVLITQSVSDVESPIEKQLKLDYPEIEVKRILAMDYETRIGVFPAFGVDEALNAAISNYNISKLNILEKKLEKIRIENEKRVKEIEKTGKDCIKKYGKIAGRIGIVPGGCIPFVHGICIKMLMELAKIVGIDCSKGFAADIFANTIVGLIVTPFMVVPGLSPLMARGYVEGVGDCYLDALLVVIEKSSDSELKNNKVVAERIKRELKKRHN